jgi:thioredoxin-related protein
MKSILFAILISSSFFVNAQFSFEENLEEEQNEEEVFESQESAIQWLTNIGEAKKISAQTKKPILVYFSGSDWCAPCKALKSDFFGADKFQKEYSSDFVFVMIDYPRRKDILTEAQYTYNRSIIETYNKSKTFPKVVMLNHKGKELGKISGYSSFNSYKDTSYHYTFVDKYVSN